MTNTKSQSARGKRKNDKPFGTIDCETDPFLFGRIPEPFIWGLYFDGSFQTFTNTGDLCREIRDIDAVFYAHNGGKFDFHFLLSEINLDEKISVINGRLVVAHIGTAEIRDSWNILPIPLAAYKKTEVDYSIFEAEERDKPHNQKIIRDYLKDDCVDLYNLIEEFERDNGRHLTQAGASMDSWKKISKRPAPKTDRAFFKEFSQYYYGGRVQCFQTGKIEGPIETYDIISAYPWAMLSHHPYSPEYTVTEKPDKVVGTSMVTVSCVSNGALPWRNDKGSIVFPDDRERRTYKATGHELLAAMDTHSVSGVEIIRAVDFIGLVSFAEYIQRWFDVKQHADSIVDEYGPDYSGDDPRFWRAKAVRLLAKLKMNSLYGKFAANPDNYGNYMCVEFDRMADYIEDGYEFEGLIGPHALLRAPLDPWQENFINVATAASITGQVRAHLWRAIHASEAPIYCDTDSLFCKKGHALTLGNKLGDWKPEGLADRAYIAGKKLYALDMQSGKTKQASKGVRLTAEEIKRAATGETVTARSEAPTFRLHGTPMFQVRNVRATAGPQC